ncbi:hypothetical protein OEB99_04325 [Actinotalea sp. M2MS4P-6]|uniref:hypothetical protein n=1 Tax=Actinotalea sp. M2MS4P-6 TaxID=2983762 RepID=UPI0021E4A135|nr:hypothetical protein [Actinotalea sp. M2MS4P-6]MCV2393525.1 hypothetical protein [Actinotalea sp. M2MS4P-6]
MRTVLVALATLLTLLVAAPAHAEEQVPPEVSALARVNGLPYLAKSLSGAEALEPSRLGLTAAHAVHEFDDAWIDGAEDAAVITPTTGWVVPWTDNGLPAGLLRIELVAGSPTITGAERDPVVAGALVSWDGQGDLVEEPQRARWFALQGTTLVTLAGDGEDGVPLASSYPTSSYAADLRASGATTPSPAPGALLSASSPPPVAALTALVGLLLAAGLVTAIAAARRRTASAR